MGEAREVVVFQAYTDVEALLYESMLREAGISVMRRSSADLFIIGIVTPPDKPKYELLVLEQDAERARQYVIAFHEAAENGALQLPTEEQTRDEEDHAI
jgi:hypothetical protein